MKTDSGTRVRTLCLAIALAWSSVGAVGALAATPTEINDAITKGLDYLYTAQNHAGYWNYGGYEPAATGAAVYAMLSQRSHWGSNAANYQAAVDNAMVYLLNNATVQTVATRNDGVAICPGGGSCSAVYWNAAGNEDSYTTGLIAPAIALYAAGKGGPGGTSTATAGALVGKTWHEIAQGITNTWSTSQSTANQGALIGGWRYGLNDGYDSDMSTTQWGIISLIYDNTLGATTPSILATDLAKWLAFAQSSSTGAGCYQGPGSGLCDNSDTGGLLVGLKFIGKASSDPAVQKAIGFLNANWTGTASGTWYGNFGHPYAMWSEYKALELTLGLTGTGGITNLLPGDCGGDIPIASCNWWQDMNQWLVANQNASGGWGGYSYWGDPLATAFYLPILGGTEIPGPEPSAPEPGTLALIALGLAGLGVGARQRQPKA